MEETLDRYQRSSWASLSMSPCAPTPKVPDASATLGTTPTRSFWTISVVPNGTAGVYVGAGAGPFAAVMPGPVPYLKVSARMSPSLGRLVPAAVARLSVVLQVSSARFVVLRV